MTSFLSRVEEIAPPAKSALPLTKSPINPIQRVLFPLFTLHFKGQERKVIKNLIIIN